MPKKIIRNVLVFDGTTLHGPDTVVIDGALIGDDPEGAAEEIDGSGHTLMPGLIDCHVHVSEPDDLDTLSRHGVTTALDMGAMPPGAFEKISSAAAQKPTTYRSSGLPAFDRQSEVFRMLVDVGHGSEEELAVSGDAGVESFVEARAAEGSHFIKVHGDVPGFSDHQLARLASLAKAGRKLSIAHATHLDSYARCQAAGFDVLTHVPVERVLSFETVDKLAKGGAVVVPTLSMMGRMEVMNRRFPRLEARPCDYRCARANVAALRRAGVPVLAGSDSNTMPVLRHPHGESLWLELELLVDAGMRPYEALQAATSEAARHFDLPDRGQIKPGLRADLVLVEGNPCERIEHIRRIRRAWSGGDEIDLRRRQPPR